MSPDFRRGAQELADEVARAHESGPGLPVGTIGVRARRARRRHDAAVLGASAAVVAVVVLGGAALADRQDVAPPAGPTTPTQAPTSPEATEPTTSPETPTPAPGASEEADATAPTSVLAPDDLDRLALDPAVLSAAIDGLGELTPSEVDLGGWGLDPAVVIDPSDVCRPALTVVADEPPGFARRGWGSGTASVTQELVVLPDAARAASAFETLGASLDACPEFGASLPGSSGAWHVVASIGHDTAGIVSHRVAGSEWGEGNELWWVQVDALVGNAILRTEVYLFEEPVASAADADAVAELVEAAIEGA